jgi:hypothetical protein
MSIKMKPFITVQTKSETGLMMAEQKPLGKEVRVVEWRGHLIFPKQTS